MLVSSESALLTAAVGWLDRAPAEKGIHGVGVNKPQRSGHIIQTAACRLPAAVVIVSNRSL